MASSSIVQKDRYHKTKPRQAGPPADNQISSILTFDPENMKMSDVQNIASNADNLIRIIQNIKDQVEGQ